MTEGTQQGIVASACAVALAIVLGVFASRCNKQDNELAAECLRSGKTPLECRAMMQGQGR